MSAWVELGSEAIEPGQAIWLLSRFCALHQRSMDSNAVARECLPPMQIDRLRKLGAELGLTIACSNAVNELNAVRLPAAVHVRVPKGDATVVSTASSEWVIVLQLEGTSATVVSPQAAAPAVLPVPELLARMTGRVLLFSATVADAPDPESTAKSRPAFGFSYFVPELLKHRSIWRDVLIASLVLQLMSLAVPLFTQAIIDKVVVHRTQSTLIALAIGMAVFIVFTASLTWVRQYLILHTGNRVDAALGSDVFSHLFKLPPRYFQHRPTGIVSARLQGVETIRDFISSAAVTLALDLPFLLIFVAIMFWYSATLTWIVLGILALIVGTSALAAPLLRQRLNEQFLRGAANQAFVTEYVAGLETVKALQLEPQLNRRYHDLLAASLNASLRTKQLANSYSTAANGLDQLLSLLILTFGAYLVMTSTSFTVGMLVAFQMFSSRLSQPMLRLVGLWQQFQQARISIARLGDIMNAPVEPYRLTRTRAQAPKGVLQIEGLAFRYEENLPYLYDGFDLNIAAGHLIAIMGPSGAGKSTLAKLLLGFEQPSAGVIRIDGVDLRYLSANELRSHFGVVPQETTLFSGTIFENLRIANPFASFDQVVAACRMAEIHSTIEAMPNGYETTIGERGAGLSGGQRQRIAIARALIKGPKILIFDEATSSLDATTADQLGRTINALKGRATILFIAHALPKTLQVDHTVRIGDKLSIVSGTRPGGEPLAGEQRRAEATGTTAIAGLEPV